MHYIYEAYTREVNGESYFFVKRHLHFPEWNQVPDLMEGFGMHRDFQKACHIAGVEGEKLISQIFEQMNLHTEAAKVIDISTLSAGSEIRSNAV